MKKTYKYILCAGLMFMGLTSCTDYLDKAPESTVSGDEAFKNFINFQGFIEEIYNCIPDKEKCNYCTSWNWGDDELFNSEGNAHMTNQVDIGNFRNWESNGQCWLNRTPSNPRSNDPFQHSLWGHSWYCIRKANVGLANLDKLVGSQIEKDMIAGQLYFFRAWWHFEMMEWWGGLPYIDHVLGASETLNFPRLSFQECAEKAAEDFRKAADLLPIDWDDTAPGRNTLGHNDLRVNKIAALGYLGKCWLWAASPLMEHGAQLGALASGTTYDYNKEYCEKAAEAFGELLELVESGQTQYALATFDYDNVYDHDYYKSKPNNYSGIFYTSHRNWEQPGGTEAIFRGYTGNSDGNGNNTNWNVSKLWGPKVASLVEHDKIIHLPTANLVDMYGMANGLPLDDPDSGWDAAHPFQGRDPRFYHDIVFDGFHYVLAADKLDEARAPYEYLNLSSYTGNEMRSADAGSRTGYFFQKLIPHVCNFGDQAYAWGDALHAGLSYMRLADIYLMYAESLAAIGGASATSTTCPTLSALDAVNKIRVRCGAEGINAKYTADNRKFMDEIRRERAVELSMEGFRFNDLQRWLLLTEAPYTEKYSAEFTRVHDDDWYKENDPRDAEVRDFKNVLVLTRKFGTKHYWFPLPENDTYLYEAFGQNPGW